MSRIFIIDDDEANAARLPLEERGQCHIRLHQVVPRQKCPQLLNQCPFFEEPSRQELRGRTTMALEMICRAIPSAEAVEIIVAANSSYGCQPAFLSALRQSSLDFSVVVRPSTKVRLNDRAEAVVSDLVGEALWERQVISHPASGKQSTYHIADIGQASLHGVQGRLLIARLPRVRDQRAGTLFAFTSCQAGVAKKLIKVAFWAKWIKPFIRQRARVERRSIPVLAAAQARVVFEREEPVAAITIRPNIAAARQQDEIAALDDTRAEVPRLHGALSATSPILNVAELFAGAGGMGLGFLMATHPNARYRLIFSGELHPIYTRTLRRNHQNMPLPAGCARVDYVPQDVQPCDLRQQEAADFVTRQAEQSGGLHILIGGPPCQGFSSANRSSGYSGNPNNRLVEVFLQYVERLRPLVFLMENVQGIVWTPKNGEAGSPMVVEDLARRMAAMNYLVFPKLLDAAWYGVPQHRSRFFLLGIHRDLGYNSEGFGQWGPFPLPSHFPGAGRNYVAVQNAFQDLPAIENGHSALEIPYEPADQTRQSEFLNLMRKGAPQGVIWDHVASQHARYVIERYRAIPPGGNWENIRHLMANYANTDCTHSNIYRRLKMEEPSITIGHYRKSMLIHPQQHRGLSLREAARLQSFPDWFRFVGTMDGDGSERSGLTHKQQQLANAVCPLMLKAIAEYLLHL